MSGDNRLRIYNDQFDEGGFVVKSGEAVFARLNRIAGKWRVWLYGSHTQRDFPKIRDALSGVEEEFMARHGKAF